MDYQFSPQPIQSDPYFTPQFGQPSPQFNPQFNPQFIQQFDPHFTPQFGPQFQPQCDSYFTQQSIHFTQPDQLPYGSIPQNMQIDTEMSQQPFVQSYNQSYIQVQSQRQIQDELVTQFFTKYDISRTFQEDIDEIKKYDIIVIADDSGSMKEPSRYLSFDSNCIVNGTRWNELKETVAIVTELAVLLDDDGIDIRFLNDSTYYSNITTPQQVMSLFNRQPQGRTPLTRVLSEVMNYESLSGKPRLILIITDGEPNNDSGYNDCDNFYRLLKNRNAKNNRISILACTTSDNQMDWLNKIDKDAQHVDVIDDYLSERDQILAVQGKSFSYSHGDHIVKMLLGPILQKYDDLDEKKFNSTGCTKISPTEALSNFIRSPYSNQLSKHKNYRDNVHNDCKCIII